MEPGFGGPCLETMFLTKGPGPCPTLHAKWVSEVLAKEVEGQVQVPEPGRRGRQDVAEPRPLRSFGASELRRLDSEAYQNKLQGESTKSVELSHIHCLFASHMYMCIMFAGVYIYICTLYIYIS